MTGEVHCLTLNSNHTFEAHFLSRFRIQEALSFSPESCGKPPLDTGQAAVCMIRYIFESSALIKAIISATHPRLKSPVQFFEVVST